MTLAARPSRRYPSESIPGLARKVDAHWYRLDDRFNAHFEGCDECKTRNKGDKAPYRCPRGMSIALRADQVAALWEKLEGSCPICGAEKGECQGDHEE